MAPTAHEISKVGFRCFSQEKLYKEPSKQHPPSPTCQIYLAVALDAPGTSLQPMLPIQPVIIGIHEVTAEAPRTSHDFSHHWQSNTVQ